MQSMGAMTATRVMGLDLGDRWIGLAVSDSQRRMAVPRLLVERSGDWAIDHGRIQAVVCEDEIGLVVVGLPLSMAGTVGPAARAALLEVERLGQVLAVPVQTCDERLSSATALGGVSPAMAMGGSTHLSDGRALKASRRGQGAKRGISRGKVRSKTRAGRVDAQAAAVILQAWLDRQT